MKKLFINLIDKIKKFWGMIPDKIKRIWHTAWITFAITFGGGLIPVISTYLTDNNLHSATTAVGALVITSLVTAGTVIRVALAKWIEGKD